MFSALIRFSLQFRFLILAGAAALALLCVFRLPNLPVDALPEFSPPIIEIQTEALGLSASEVEDLVTLNLEELLSGVSWLKSITSKSITGLSSVILVFEPGTNLMRARQLVQERLNMAYAMPNVSKPPVMLQPVSTTNRVMMIGLSPKDVSLIEASVVARWTITPKLMGVPGVANVSVWGQRPRQLQVQVDPRRLRDSGITLNQVIESTGEALWVSSLSYLKASTPGTGGWIDTPNQRLGIQHVQPITSAQELATVAIPSTPMRLGDVAKVVEGHPPLIGDAIIGDRPGLLLVIEKFPNASSLAVARGVNAALDELRHGLTGIEIDATVFRSNSFIDLALANLRIVLLVASILLFLTIAAFFRSWRAALIGVASVALSLGLVSLAIYSRGATFNLLVLTGIGAALPAIIASVIFDANETNGGTENPDTTSPDDRTHDAYMGSRQPALYVTVILILAATPLFFLEGSLGALLRPLALSYVFTLLASLLTGLTFAPALSMFVRRRPASSSASTSWRPRRFEAMLGAILHAPRSVYVVTAIALLAGAAILPFLRWSIFPAFQERDVRVRWEAAPGTSLAEMRREMVRASEELRRISGVRNVTGHLGRAVTGDQVVGIESGQLWINISPAANYDATIAAIKEAVQGYPGIAGQVETYLTSRLRSTLAGPGLDEPLLVRVEGPERDVLQREAMRVAQLLSDTPGLGNLRVKGRTETPQVQIKVDLASAGRAGIKPGDVRRTAATIFSGLEVGNLFEQQKVFDVVVWGAPAVRQSVTAVKNLLIDGPGDSHVNLADVADVSVVPTPTVIDRDGISRYRDVAADVTGNDPAAVIREVKARVQRASFPLEYHAVVLDQYTERHAMEGRHLAVALAAALGVYLILQARFQNWRLASLLFFSLPVSLTGGIVALWIAGGIVSLGSIAGALAVAGISAHFGILLIGHFQRLQQNKDEAFGPELVRRGATEQFRAVAASTAGIAAVLIPILALTPVAGLEILHPMAVVMLGGILVSALFNLFAIPALYLLVAEPEANGVAEGLLEYQNA